MRQAHNLKVVGSNPTPATNKDADNNSSTNFQKLPEYSVSTIRKDFASDFEVGG